jgi:hypothetical protein
METVESYRVVAVRADQTQIILDEGLTLARAQEIKTKL